MAARANRFHGLDLLRGVAALLCMLYHVTMEFHLKDPLFTAGGVEFRFKLGFLAVDLFYLASGYVMARSFASKPASGGVTAFYKGRFKRLWLPYAVGCLLGAAVALKAGWDPAKVFPSLALMLLFLPSPFIGKGVFGLNSPGWTLTFQMMADLLHFLAFSRMKTWLLAALWLAGSVALWVWTMQLGWLYAGTSFGHFPYCVIRTLVPYLGGILAFRLLQGRTLPAVPWWIVQVALPVLVIGGESLPQPLLQLVFVIALCPLLLLGSMQFSANATLQRVASWMGAFSYPLFAVHMPVLHLFRDNGWSHYGAAVASILLGAAVTEAAKRLPAGFPFHARQPALRPVSS